MSLVIWIAGNTSGVSRSSATTIAPGEALPRAGPTNAATETATDRNAISNPPDAMERPGR